MPTHTTPELSLHFLVVLDGETWVAHCLDFDIAAQGESASHAVENLVHAVELLLEQSLEDESPDCLFQSAPQALWDLYVKAPPGTKGAKKIPLNVRKSRGRKTAKPRKILVEERQQVPA